MTKEECLQTPYLNDDAAFEIINAHITAAEHAIETADKVLSVLPHLNGMPLTKKTVRKFYPVCPGADYIGQQTPDHKTGFYIHTSANSGLYLGIQYWEYTDKEYRFDTESGGKLIPDKHGIRNIICEIRLKDLPDADLARLLVKESSPKNPLYHLDQNLVTPSILAWRARILSELETLRSVSLTQ